MAGPWFVDPDNGLTTNNGLSDSTPWKLIPGQTGASAQTGYGVVAGDTINVKNGTTSTLQLQPPANNLTYRGYGLASNVLSLVLPAKDPTRTRVVRVVRERGAHEGMWTLNGAGLGTSALDVQNARTGVTIEDVQVLGDTSGSSNAVTLGTSAAGTQSGITMRRFEIRGAGGKGFSCYKINPTLEWFKISGTVDDCWTIAATATNLYRAGSVDTVRYFELVEPNVNASGVLVGDSGDGWQTLHASGRFESALTVSDWTLTKTNDIKQGFLLCDGIGGATVRRFNIRGTPTSQATGLLTCLRGNVTIEDGYWSEGCLNNAVVRLRSSETALAKLQATGTTLTLRRLVVNSPGGMNHLFDAAELTETLEMDGALVIEDCTTVGPVAGGLSYGAVVPLQGGNTTYGTNFVLTMRENCFDSSGTQVRLPSGTAGNANYAVARNRISGVSYIGATSYASTSAFEAAHNAATGNIAGDPLLKDGGIPGIGSPALTSGNRHRRDIRGNNGRSHIGAYSAPLSRGASASRSSASARSLASERS